MCVFAFWLELAVIWGLQRSNGLLNELSCWGQRGEMFQPGNELFCRVQLLICTELFKTKRAFEARDKKRLNPQSPCSDLWSSLQNFSSFHNVLFGPQSLHRLINDPISMVSWKRFSSWNLPNPPISEPDWSYFPLRDYALAHNITIAPLHSHQRDSSLVDARNLQFATENVGCLFQRFFHPPRSPLSNLKTSPNLIILNPPLHTRTHSFSIGINEGMFQ